MTDAAAGAWRAGPRPSAAWAGLAIVAAAVLLPYLAPEALAWARTYPARWVVPVSDWLKAALFWLVRDLDFGLFTFKDLTRAVAACFSWALEVPKAIFATGAGIGGIHLPRLSWAGLTLGLALWGHALGGRRLALLAFAGFAYIAAFGQWDSAMATLSQVVLAVALGAAGGLMLGIWAYRRPRLEKGVAAVLDFMQTVPTFAYLVPLVFLIGVGPVSGLLATICYAMPPMVRITMLALKQVPVELDELGRMTGCNPRQSLWKVLVPSARDGLLVGLNQVIMLTLNMIIIAAMVGSGGLGFDVLNALRSPNGLGKGLEAGVAVVALAIVLDRLSRALVELRPARGAVAARRCRLFRAGLGVMLGLTLLSAFVPMLEDLPKGWRLSTGTIWSDAVSWFNLNLFTFTDAIRTWTLMTVLVPLKGFLIGFPWTGLVALVGAAGWALGGPGLGLGLAAMMAFIPATGLWDRGMTTIYLCGISSAVAVAAGLPLGVLGARSARLHKALEVLCDTLQTLPSFVYLLPVVVLFRIGDMSAMVAIVAYSVVPAIRYTDHGLRRVPPALTEAGLMAGCTPGQRLAKVELPYALPEIMLGVNQVVMMALSMLVVSSFVGTNDLGKQIQVAIAQADPGKGLLAGICIAFLGIIADRLIGRWALARKRKMGLP